VVLDDRHHARGVVLAIEALGRRISRRSTADEVGELTAD
jgi:hypothetical protein